MNASRLLGDRRWPELDGPPIVTLLVPVGSLEQHGPHLPLDTDTRIAHAVAQAAAHAVAGGSVLVSPAVSFGASGEHETFPGTVSIGTEGLRTLLVELGRSAGRWARRLVFVNGHGGNLEALGTAVTLLRAEGRDVRWFGCFPPGGDAHAGRAETSIMLALAPRTVRLELARAGNVAPLAELLPLMRASSVRAVSANGVLGDPAGASADEGRTLLAAMVGELVAVLAHRGRPYLPLPCNSSSGISCSAAVSEP
ncbi:MAG: mycofactocin biosynthesis peptidyl-dipeptidase MftE [Pseudonocardia sp.]|nr:mycofactocin biosynthesis peptidyl-dipeptidase MftE [Pseudonocardia sp.]